MQLKKQRVLRFYHKIPGFRKSYFNSKGLSEYHLQVTCTLQVLWYLYASFALLRNKLKNRIYSITKLIELHLKLKII